MGYPQGLPHTSLKHASYSKITSGKTQTWTTCVWLGMRWRTDISSGTYHSLWCLGNTCLCQYTWHTWSQARILVGTRVWVTAHKFKMRKANISSSPCKHWANRMMSFASSHCWVSEILLPSPTVIAGESRGERWIAFYSGDFRIILFYLAPLSS